MHEPTDVFEKYVFFSSRKQAALFRDILSILFHFPLDDVNIEFSDRPSEAFTALNDRTKKILFNLSNPDKVGRIFGSFTRGGSFEASNATFAVVIEESQYNFELVDSMKHMLSPTFPLCVFRNPYIWGVNMYEIYDRAQFFEARRYSSRSQLLEEPEVDIFRRDNGVIYKLRFHLEQEPEDIDSGIRLLAPLFRQLQEGLKKGAYEGLEVLHAYCSDRPAFRRMDTRTKLGKEIWKVLARR